MLDFDLKAFGPFQVKDADKGEVSAVVATLNVVDRDGDVILPGAVPTGAKVKLSGYGHDVVLQDAPPVGVGSISEESEQLIFHGRFFMTTERGREAFLTVKELGADGEWSFGFPRAVKTADLTEDWRAKGAKRIIAGLTPIEASPVFIGAGRNTRTLGVKAAESLTERVEAVHNALWERNDGIDKPWYAHEIFEEYIIVSAGYSKYLRVPYSVGADGKVTLGDAVEVEVVYQPVKAATIEQDNKAALQFQEATIYEFERFQRTLRRFGVA